MLSRQKLTRFIPRRLLLGRLAVIALGLLAAHCANKSRPDADSSVSVFAAASLRELFQSLEQDFERSNPGVKVTINFAGSQELRSQIEHGAQADIFAPADPSYLDSLRAKDLVSESVLFTCNDLVVVVPRNNPSEVKAFDDLPKAKRIVLGVTELPVGKYAAEVLKKASTASAPTFREQVEAKVVSRELSVKHVLAKVALGEADAGIVYRTDARSSAGVQTIDIPREYNIVAKYHVATLKHGAGNAPAQKWIALLKSEPAKKTMGQMGFLTCPAND